MHNRQSLKRLINDKKYNEIINIYNNAVKNNTLDADICEFAIIVNIRLQNDEEVLKICDKAIGTKNSNPYIFNCAISSAYFSKKYGKVLDYFNRLSDFNMLDEDSLTMIIKSCCLKNKYNMAMDVYKKALINNKVNGNVFIVAMEINNLNLYLDKTIKIYDDAVKFKNINSDVCSCAMITSNVALLYDKTIEIYKTALNTNNIDNYLVFTEAIKAFYRLGRYTDVLEIYNNIIDRSNIRENNLCITYRYVLESLCKLGKYDEAFAISNKETVKNASKIDKSLAKVIDKVKELKGYFDNLQKIFNKKITIEGYYKLGIYEKAVELFNKEIKRNNININMLNYAMKSYYEMADYENVSKLYNIASEKGFINDEILANVIKTKYIRKQYEDIIEIYNSNKKLINNNIEAILYVVKSYYDLEKYDAIPDIYNNEALLVNADHTNEINRELFKYAIKTSCKLAKYEDVLDMYNQVKPLYLNFDIVDAAIFSCNKLKKYNDAKAIYNEYFSRVQFEDNRKNDFILNIFETYYNLKDYISVLEAYNVFSMGEDISNVKDYSPFVYLFLANCKLGKYAEAENLYNNYLNNLEDKDKLEILPSLIKIYYNSNEYEKILNICQKDKNFSDNVDFDIYSMRANYKLGNYAKARDIYNELKNNKEISKDIAIDSLIINSYFENYNEAIYAYTQLPDNEKNSYDVLYNMMKSNYKINNYKEAKSFYKKLRNNQKAQNDLDVKLYGIAIYDSLKAYNEIIDIYDTLSDTDKNNIDISTKAIISYYNLKKYDKVLDVYKNIKNKENLNTQIFVYVINSIKNNKKYDNALDVCNTAIEYNKANLEIFEYAIKLLKNNFIDNRERQEKILNICNQCIKTREYNDNILGCMIEQKFKLGQYSDVVDILNNKNNLLFNNKELINYFIQSCYKTKNYCNIFQFCRKNESIIDKIDLKSTMFLMDAYIKLYPRALKSFVEKWQIQDYELLLKLYNNINDSEMSENILSNFIKINYNFGKYKDAINICNRAYKINKLNSDAIVYTIKSIYSLGDYSRLLDLYNKLKISKNIKYSEITVEIIDSINKTFRNSYEKSSKILEFYNDIIDANQADNTILQSALDISIELKRHDMVLKIFEKYGDDIDKKYKELYKSIKFLEKFKNLKDKNITSKILKDASAAFYNLEEYDEVEKLYQKSLLLGKTYSEIFEYAIAANDKLYKDFEVEKYNKISAIYDNAFKLGQLNEKIINYSIKNSYLNQKYKNVFKIYKNAIESDISTANVFLYTIKSIRKFYENDKNRKFLYTMEVYKEALKKQKINKDILFNVMQVCEETREYEKLENVYNYAVKNNFVSFNMHEFMLRYYSDSYQYDKFLDQYKIFQTLGCNTMEHDNMYNDAICEIKKDKAKKEHKRSVSL